jgi:hypothetical protein
MSFGDLLSEGWDKLKGSFSVQTGGKGYKDETGDPTYGTDWGQIASIGGLIGSATGILGSGPTPPTGYQGSIPEYDAVRERVPGTYDPNRRAGSGGQRYFTQTQYQPKSDTPAEPMSAEGLAALNAANPAQEMNNPVGIATPVPFNTTNNQPADEVVEMAAGGIAQLKKGQYLNGASDGMADKVPANIDGVQEARLSDGEFVIPADVVSHLGNGNSDAGAKVLKNMMSRVRKARTGNDKQGKEINPNKFIPA